jgi:undecaprenyl diphosphate synthase
MFKRKAKVLPPLEGKLSHIAFIMDGNGRWAKKRGLMREFGHEAGAKAFQNLVEYCAQRGLQTMTFYAFSTENWQRPAHEVQAIMKLLDRYLDRALASLQKYDVRILFLGDKSILEPALKEKMCRAEAESAHHQKTLQIAFNYGGRAEIVHAANQAIAKGKSPLTEADIEENLYTLPNNPPDLIVRTAGEMRLSNFLLWQAAYAEFYFADCLWPDFTPDELEKAITAYFQRKRRFGGL